MNNNNNTPEPNITTYIEGRYLLSYVLSFLNEKDGVNTLITNKRWYRRILPLFRVVHNHNATVDTTIAPPRYRFCILPVQDSYVLLHRLNTKRLAKRILYYKQSKLPGGVSSVHPHHIMSTDEMAWYEWEQQLVTSNLPNESTYSTHPCHLELLRYNTPLTSISRSISSVGASSSSIPTLLPGITLLVSYPRSGNTLLRTLLERITNIVTGSDTRPDRSLSQALAVEHNLVGEGVTSSIFTPIVKSHFPERLGYLRFSAQRIVLVVRNPYDAIDSYWNMCCTNTHTQTVQESVYEKYAQKFRSLAHHEMETWIRFHAYWMNPFLDREDDERHTSGNEKRQAGLEEYDSGLPVLIVRYEDLILNTLSTMARVMSFILNKEDDPSLENLHPFWRRRLFHGLGISQEGSSTAYNSASLSVEATMKLGSYTPRISSTMEESTQTSSWNSKANQDVQDKVSHSSTTYSQPQTPGLLIGKALAKKRYSQDTLQYMHHVASTLEMNVLQSLSYHDRQVSPNKKNVPSSWLQWFGYDIMNQQFPLNFSEAHENKTRKIYIKRQKKISPLDRDGKNRSIIHEGIIINNGNEGIRAVWDEFGRAMTEWRKGETVDDTQTFPTIQKK